MMLKFSSPRRLTCVSGPNGSERKTSICRMPATVGMISPFSRKSGPSTPTTSYWLPGMSGFWNPFNVMSLPTMPGSAPNARRQNA